MPDSFVKVLSNEDKVRLNTWWPPAIRLRLLRKQIDKNVATWNKQQKKTVDRSIVLRARNASKVVEDWSIEQKKRWSEVKIKEDELKQKPFEKRFEKKKQYIKPPSFTHTVPSDFHYITVA